jgi:hypothetical protein
MKKASLFMIFLFSLFSISAITLSESNNRVTADGVPMLTELVPNFFWGSANGTFNETAAYRPFTTNNDTVINVCTLNSSSPASQCDFYGLQNAIDNLSLIIRHDYRMYLENGRYEEDVYIPTLITNGLFYNGEEGSSGLLWISGSESNRNAVQVRSFQVSSVIGSYGLTINNMQIFGVDPTSDENVSISVYSSNDVRLKNLNITGNSKFAIMSYGSKVNAYGIYFNGQRYGVYTKVGGQMKAGDWTSGNGLYGAVDDSIAFVSGYSIHMNNFENVSYGIDEVICSDRASVVYMSYYDGNTSQKCVDEIELDNKVVIKAEDKSYTVNESLGGYFWNSRDTSGSWSSNQDRASIEAYSVNTFGTETGLFFYTSNNINTTRKAMSIDHNRRLTVEDSITSKNDITAIDNIYAGDRVCFDSVTTCNIYLDYNGSCIVKNDPNGEACI